MNIQITLKKWLIKYIRDEVKSGKTKIEVANQLGIGYYTVKKYTRDIPTNQNIPKQLQQRIREEIKKGKSTRQVANELDVSRDTVIKYTRDIPKNPVIKKRRSPEQIEQIRANVRKYNSKMETSRKMGLTYRTVEYYTQDILIKRGISPDVIEKIRNEVKKGKLKTQVAKEMDLSLNMVSRHTMDIQTTKKKVDISYKSFQLLQELLKKGYAFSCSQYGCKEYQILKMKIPSVYKAKISGRTIFYMDEKSDIAAEEFLRTLNKRIMSYQELMRILKLFKTNMKPKEKNKYLHNKNYEGTIKENKKKKPGLLKNEDSCIDFYPRNYQLSTN
jgi:DNA-binding CsgD family transcriptional regulator